MANDCNEQQERYIDLVSQHHLIKVSTAATIRYYKQNNQSLLLHRVDGPAVIARNMHYQMFYLENTFIVDSLEPNYQDIFEKSVKEYKLRAFK